MVRCLLFGSGCFFCGLFCLLYWVFLLFWLDWGVLVLLFFGLFVGFSLVCVGLRLFLFVFLFLFLLVFLFCLFFFFGLLGFWCFFVLVLVFFFFFLLFLVVCFGVRRAFVMVFLDCVCCLGGLFLFVGGRLVGCVLVWVFLFVCMVVLAGRGLGGWFLLVTVACL